MPFPVSRALRRLHALGSANRTDRLLQRAREGGLVGDLLGWDRPDAGRGAERPTLRAGLLGTTYMAAIRPFRHLIVCPPLIKQIERDWRAGAGDPTATRAWRAYVLHAVAQAVRRCA